MKSRRGCLDVDWESAIVLFDERVNGRTRRELVTIREVTMRILFVFCWALALLTAVDVSSAHAQDGVDFVIVDAPNDPVRSGEIFSIKIQVQAGAQQVDGAQINLDFDPAILNVVSLTPGSTLSVPIKGPKYDNDVGTIDYAAGVFSNFPSGMFDLLTITFEVVDLRTTSLGYSSFFPRKTDVTFGGLGILGTADGIEIQAQDPLAITLAWFFAEQVDRITNIRWQTATETGTAGFNILVLIENSKVHLNSDLIPSKGIDSVEPIDYSFSATTDASLFYLQEVNLDGNVDESGPYELGVDYGIRIPIGNVELHPMIWLPIVFAFVAPIDDGISVGDETDSSSESVGVETDLNRQDPPGHSGEASQQENSGLTPTAWLPVISR